jgi:membrane protease YdiL (CAAX protease family)
LKHLAKIFLKKYECGLLPKILQAKGLKMENNQQSNIFDEIIVYIGYVLLVPTFIGFLIGKLVTRCYYQALVNKRFHNKKILSLLLFFGFCLTLIFIGTFIFCILNIVLFKQVI